MFGGDRDSVPDLRQPEIRHPIFSCLKRFSKNLPSLYNPEDYNITKSLDGVFSVNVDSDIVFVSELNIDKPVMLKDSIMFRRWQEA